MVSHAVQLFANAERKLGTSCCPYTSVRLRSPMLRSLRDIREAVPTNLTVGIEFAAPALWSLDLSITC